jgi:hypothetical protein
MGYGLLLGAYVWGQCHVRHRNYLTVNNLKQEMEADYVEYNNGWFEGKLPPVSISLTNDDVMARSVCIRSGCNLQFNYRYNQAVSVAQLSLFHEMCHVATQNEDMEHGPKWHACMKDLAARGAFDNIW